jgi:tetratricopeptide (TPR) repeat protein
MALANVAAVLSQRGLRVLMIDFDLEAPGLEQFFSINQDAVRRNPGLLDLVLRYKRSMSSTGSGDEFQQLERFIYPVYEKLPSGGRLDLLPAGLRGTPEQLDQYALHLRTFDWQDFYFNWSGGLFFEWLRRSLAGPSSVEAGAGGGDAEAGAPQDAGRYDLVLTDSRTGVTEMGGICGYQLADVIAMFSAANHQNVQGTANMLRDFRSPTVEKLRRGRPLHVIVVPSRIEQRDPALVEEFFTRFDDAFAGVVPAALRGVGLSFRDLTIPYEPRFAFEERVLSDPAARARGAIATSFEKLADAIVVLAQPGSRVAVAGDARASAPEGVRFEGIGAAGRGGAAAQYDAARRHAGYDAFLDLGTREAEEFSSFVRSLQDRGLQLFYDREDLPAGAEWQGVVTDALLHSRALVFCVGASGLTSWRLRTLDHALGAQHRGEALKIIPVLLPGADAAALAGTPLAGVQVLDLSSGLDPDGLDRLARAIGDVAAKATPIDVEGRAPFVGPRPFGEEHVDLFFGREQSVSDLVERLAHSRAAVVVGPSGAGKTSFVRAGLVPEFRREAAGSGGLAVVVASPASGSTEEADAQLREATSATVGRRVLLFVDDLENLFTRTDDACDQWLSWLAQVGESLGPISVVVAALRSDYVNRAQEHAATSRLLARGRFDLPAMTLEELRCAIERPAARVGVAFEPGLVDRILADMVTEPHALGLLQHLLALLWDHRRAGWLTNAAYDGVGGLRGVLARRADEVWSALAPPQQAAFPSLMLRLVNVAPVVEEKAAAPADLNRARVPEPSSTSQDAHARNAARRRPDATRRRLRVDDPLMSDPGSWSAACAASAKFIEAGVLIASEEDGRRVLEPAHGSLVRGWRLLREWIDADLEFVLWRQRLEADVDAWRRTGRGSDHLLGGSALDTALRWRHARAKALAPVELDFVDRSRRRARATRIARVVGVASLVLLVAGVVGLSWVRRSLEAEQARLEADIRYRVAARSNAAAAAALIAEADALASRDELGAAIATYTKAIALDAQNPGAFTSRGTAALQSDRPEAAEEDFSQAIALASQAGAPPPSLAPLYAQRAHARERRYDLDGALGDFARVTELNAKDAAAWLELGRVRELRGGPGDLVEAARAYDRAIELDATLAQAFFNRASLRQRQHDRAGAVEDFRTVLALRTATSSLKTSAATRLRELNAAPAPGADTSGPVRVTVHYVAERDSEAVARLSRQLESQLQALGGRRFVIAGAAERLGVRVRGDVRYFYPQDEEAAYTVRDHVQRILAKQGTPVELALRTLDARSFPRAAPGEVEVWIPPLGAPVGAKKAN